VNECECDYYVLIASDDVYNACMDIVKPNEVGANGLCDMIAKKKIYAPCAGCKKKSDVKKERVEEWAVLICDSVWKDVV
jgi:hypothetical protein